MLMDKINKKKLLILICLNPERKKKCCLSIYSFHEKTGEQIELAEQTSSKEKC